MEGASTHVIERSQSVKGADCRIRLYDVLKKAGLWRQLKKIRGCGRDAGGEGGGQEEHRVCGAVELLCVILQW